MKNLILKLLILNLILPFIANSNPKDDDALELINTSEIILIGSMLSHTSYYIGEDIYTEYEFEVLQNIRRYWKLIYPNLWGGNINGVYQHYCVTLTNEFRLLAFLNPKVDSYILKQHSIINSNGFNFLIAHINEQLNKNIN